MMMRVAKHGGIAALAAAAALVVAACGSNSGSSGSANSGAGGVTTVRVQVPPIADVAPIYLAMKNGLFEKQGLKVEVSIGQGGSAIAAAIQSGGADIGLINYVSMIGGISNNLPIDLVAEATRGTKGNTGIVVKADSPIKSDANLKGTSIGIISTGSLSDLTGDARLADIGLAPSDVKYVTVPLPNLLASVSGGQVGGAFVTEPITSQALAAGDRLVLDAFAGSTANLPVGGYVASTKWAKQNPGTVAKFRAVVAEASKSAAPAAVRDILPSYTSIKPDQTAAISLPEFATSTDPAKVQVVADLMLKYGFLKSPVQVRDHVAPTS